MRREGKTLGYSEKEYIKGFRGIAAVRWCLRCTAVICALLCILSAIASASVFALGINDHSKDEILMSAYESITRERVYEIYYNYFYGFGFDAQISHIDSMERDYYLFVKARSDGEERVLYDDSEGKDHSFTFTFTFDDGYNGEDGVRRDISYEIKVYIKDHTLFTGELQSVRRILTELYGGKDVFLPFTFLFGVLFLILFGALMKLSGRRAGHEGAYLFFADRVPLDIFTVFVFLSWLVSLWLGYIAFGILRDDEYFRLYSSFVQVLLTWNIFISLRLCESIAANLKKGSVIKNTAVCRMVSFIIRSVGRSVDMILSLSRIGAVIFFTALSCSAILFFVLLSYVNRAWFLILVCFLVLCSAVILIAAYNVKRLGDFTRSIYEGDYEKKMDTSLLSGDLKKYGEYLNGISHGMSRTLEERMKSERMKTELITNVSHDIKTPLTSIINYTGLIKKEECSNENIREYIDIIDRQSAKLKKLIGDVIEASKASSGAVQTEMTDIDLSLLLVQLMGEYGSRMEERKLEIVSDLGGRELFVKADPRLLQRIMDNLFGNIVKYAQTGTRVYISGENDGRITRLIMKNISRSPLNISGDELMERFVRGDSSRNTEGSGLGLSIARSLSEIMGGSLSINIDGDLFKTELLLISSEAEEK